MESVKYKIHVTADTNDADYISQISDITKEQILLIQPVIEQLKIRRDKLNEDRYKNWNEWGHNWETSEYARSSVEEMYVEEGLLTEDQVDLFNEFVPYGECGVHTIESVIIYKVSETINLF